MAWINEMLARIESIDVEQICEDTFNANAEIAKELNIEQLERGEGSKTYMPDYSNTSVNMFGKPRGGIRLYETGDFYKGINFEAVSGVVHAYSTDDKSDMLETEYSNAQPLGLSSDSIIEMNKVNQPTMVEFVNEVLHL